MLKVRLELATPGLQTQCSSHWAIKLKSYCWEGVEFIQLVYCIIIYLSFLNCDWLLIREVQWFYWTQELLVPVEKFAVRMPRWDSNSQPLDYKPSPGALAIELYSSKAIAGKELSLSGWCIASLYIYHFSTVIDFSSEKYSGFTGHRSSWKISLQLEFKKKPIQFHVIPNLKWIFHFKTSLGCILVISIFFSKSVSILEFKKSPVQVHIIPNFKSVGSFWTNLGCIWVILIFFSKSASKSEFKKSPFHVHITPNFKSIVSFSTNLGCIWVILIFLLWIGFQSKI